MTNVAVNCSIVLGFLYQTVNQTASSYQLLSYGISAGTGSLVPFGTPLVTIHLRQAGRWWPRRGAVF